MIIVACGTTGPIVLFPSCDLRPETDFLFLDIVRTQDALREFSTLSLSSLASDGFDYFYSARVVLSSNPFTSLDALLLAIHCMGTGDRKEETVAKRSFRVVSGT